MKFLPLLGKSLKSDELLDLLESQDMKVIYDFDRLRENTPDCYWSSAHDLGFQLRFDEKQLLETIFIFLTTDSGFTPAELGSSDIQLFGRKLDIRQYASENAIATAEGQRNFLGTDRDWIRLDFSGHSIHYEFGDGGLRQVTLSLVERE